MKYKNMRYGFVVIALMITNLSVLAQTPKGPDEKSIQAVVIQLFDGLAALDPVAIRKPCTPDFQLLEDGEVWTVDSLTLSVDKMKSRVKNFTRVNRFEFIDTRVDGKTAWVSYFNEAVITVDGRTRNVKWLESAVLKKIGKVWKIDLLHSTRLEPTK